MESIPEQAAPELPELPELAPEADAEPDGDEEAVPVSVGWVPTDEQLRDLRTAQNNSGHPGNAAFARLLRRGNARPEVVC